jgi:monooxygenase
VQDTREPPPTAIEHVDVLVVGAGLSGIAAAHHLQRRCPDRSVAILEARATLGGTWDLFRYPGVRSDSDMYTLGYGFRPWRAAKAIAAGPAIRAYLHDTAREHGIDRRIRYRHRVTAAAWSTPDARWTLTVERASATAGAPAETVQMHCAFLFVCGGYYRYDAGHTPALPGIERYRGRVVHPQHWGDDVVVAGQRVVVIGSGATAVTLLPELAKTAAHVTMLQRSPSYLVARPSEDGLAKLLRGRLPQPLAHAVVRWKQILLTLVFVRLCRTDPQRARALLQGGVRAALGPGFDIERHFTPTYDPWRQRLCLVPDGDFFAALKSGRASVTTDTIAGFTETGIRLASGQVLDADLLVTATGLELQTLGGMTATVDGRPVDWAETLTYRGVMFGGVPNLATAFGYTNASWTLKAELACIYVCRLLNRLHATGQRQCMPVAGPGLVPQPFMDLASGYVQRAAARLPKQGSAAPWRAQQGYLRDRWALRHGRLDDGVMRFWNSAPGLRPDAAAAA